MSKGERLRFFNGGAASGGEKLPDSSGASDCEEGKVALVSLRWQAAHHRGRVVTRLPIGLSEHVSILPSTLDSSLDKSSRPSYGSRPNHATSTRATLGPLFSDDAVDGGH